MANDRDFIVKNDLQVKGTGVSTFDSSDVTVGGNLIVKADSSADLLTIDSDGVTLASPGIFTGDGSGLTNVTADITAESVFDLSNVDSSGITPIQDYVLAFDSATQKFIPSSAVASITIEDSSTVIQLINDNIDIGVILELNRGFIFELSINSPLSREEIDTNISEIISSKDYIKAELKKYIFN